MWMQICINFKDMKSPKMATEKPIVTKTDIIRMNGPYPYTKEEVKNRVSGITRNGNYRTGCINGDGQFVPKYTGRGIVYNRLIAHLDEGCKDTHFKFIYVDNELDSYHVESADYAFFGVIHKQLRNAEHPKKPDGKDYLVCPYCGQ